MKHGCPLISHMLDETFSSSRRGLAIDFYSAARWITLRSKAKKKKILKERWGKNRMPPMSLSVSPLKWNSIKLVYFFNCLHGDIFKAILKNRLGDVQMEKNSWLLLLCAPDKWRCRGNPVQSQNGLRDTKYSTSPIKSLAKCGSVRPTWQDIPAPFQSVTSFPWSLR